MGETFCASSPLSLNYSDKGTPYSLNLLNFAPMNFEVFFLKIMLNRPYRIKKIWLKMKWYYSVGNIIVISSVVISVSLRFSLRWLNPISDLLHCFFLWFFKCLEIALCFRIVWPCIVTDCFWMKPCTIIFQLFISGNNSSTCSGSFSAHHQELISRTMALAKFMLKYHKYWPIKELMIMLP